MRKMKVVSFSWFRKPRIFKRWLGDTVFSVTYLSAPQFTDGNIYGSPTRPAYTGTLSLIPSFGACTKSCFVPRYRSVVCTEAWPSKS